MPLNILLNERSIVGDKDDDTNADFSLSAFRSKRRLSHTTVASNMDQLSDSQPTVFVFSFLSFLGPITFPGGLRLARLRNLILLLWIRGSGPPRDHISRDSKHLLL